MQLDECRLIIPQKMLDKGNCQVLLRISLLLCTATALSGPDQTPPQQAPQRKLRLLPIGDGTTARARPRHPPDQDELPTYRKALWQLLRRQEQLNVEFVGSRGHVDPLGPTAIAGAHPDGQRHEGHEDWRVEQLAEGLTSRLANSYRDLHIDVAVLWAGLTDIKAGSKPEVVLHGLTRIVEELCARPGSNTTTLVCTLPEHKPADLPGMFTGAEVLDKILQVNALLPQWASDTERRLRFPVRIVDVNREIFDVGHRKDELQAWLESQKVAKAIHDSLVESMGGARQLARYRLAASHRLNPNHPSEKFRLTGPRMVMLLIAPFALTHALSYGHTEAEAARLHRRRLRDKFGRQPRTKRDAGYVDQKIG